jgi:allophanate hydrolase
MAASRETPTLTFNAKPYPFTFPVRQTALLVIDMQRDFICAGGFGEIQGGNLEAVQASIRPTKALLEACRAAGLIIFHTREGHVPDLADCPSSKLIRQAAAPGNSQHLKVIGDKGKLGRLLVRGEYGHDIVDELQPLPGETVIDKPGKGSFWNTPLMHKLKGRGITHLLVSGVTTECCFSTSIREANDRGFECCGIVEATAGYNSTFKAASLDMIHWSQGLFGFVGELQPLLDALHPVMQPQVSCGLTSPPQTPPFWDGSLDIASLQTAYRNGLSPISVAEALYERIEKYQKMDSGVWIHLQTKEAVLEDAKKLAEKYPDKQRLPTLYGIPFNVKDSIDVAGLPTTTACLPLTHIPPKSARAHDLIKAQGGLFMGKANLDQLATGLSGCRSPYGMPHSVFNQKYISGGSSSGSCVSVGADLVTFSLATDTAGSGRVPSGFNGVIGYKPTRGLISFEGVTPACLSLDCIAIIAKNVDDARTVWQCCEGYDANDRYARNAFSLERHVNSLGHQARSFKFAVPPPEVLEICSPVYRRMFNQAIQRLQGIGGLLTPVDWAPFQKANDLLYEGTFVSERLASLPDDFLDKNRQLLHPVILELFEKVIARNSTAVQAYRDLQAKSLLTRQAYSQFAAAAKDGLTTIVVPTAPEHPLISSMMADPINLNARLGTFTHFGNVLDLCAVATPAGTYPTSELDPSETGELPFSVTFVGASCTDSEVLAVAGRFFEAVYSGDKVQQ